MRDRKMPAATATAPPPRGLRFGGVTSSSGMRPDTYQRRRAETNSRLPQTERQGERLATARATELDGVDLVELRVEIEELLDVLDLVAVDRRDDIVRLDAERGGDGAAAHAD